MKIEFSESGDWSMFKGLGAWVGQVLEVFPRASARVHAWGRVLSCAYMHHAKRTKIFYTSIFQQNANSLINLWV